MLVSFTGVCMRIQKTYATKQVQFTGTFFPSRDDPYCKDRIVQASKREAMKVVPFLKMIENHCGILTHLKKRPTFEGLSPFE